MAILQADASKEEQVKAILHRAVRDHMWDKQGYIPPILDAVDIALMEA